MNLSSGRTSWIAGAAAAVILLPLLVFGAGMPLWAACLVSVAAGGGLSVSLSPRKPFARLNKSGAAHGKIAFARDLLTDAEPLAERLETAASSIGTPKVADRIRHMARLAREIFAGVEDDPLRVDRVRRFLTYYLPRAADLAENYALMERGAMRDASRFAAADELIERLDSAFTHYVVNLQQADLGNFDIELKLLRDALDDDLGPSDDRSKA
jgi:5-bromo-4-chloroindolyl phosphate hydrolysis protein